MWDDSEGILSGGEREKIFWRENFFFFVGRVFFFGWRRVVRKGSML